MNKGWRNVLGMLLQALIEKQLAAQDEKSRDAPLSEENPDGGKEKQEEGGESK